MKTALVKLVVVCIAFTTALPAIPARANDAERFFLQGNEYYQKGDYAAAIAAYQKILQSGHESWEVYYNIGNCYYKQRNISQTILYFERAKKLAREHEDVNYNLELANLGIVDRIQELPQLFIVRWFSKVSHLLNLQQVGIITVALYGLLVVVSTLRGCLRARRSGRMSSIPIAICAILLILMGSIFVSRVVENETRFEAVILADKVDVRSSPNESGTEVFTLHEGVKVKIEDKSLTWIKIRLPDGKIGWVNENVIEGI